MLFKRTLLYHTRYRKDFKRVSRGLYAKSLQADLMAVLPLLLDDLPLPPNLRMRTIDPAMCFKEEPELVTTRFS